MKTASHLILLLKTIVFTILLCKAGVVAGSIDEGRQFQLDSITTNVDRTIKKDLLKVHAYLHAQGKNDEERVFMFYGFIATHFKYDDDRKHQKDRPEYSNSYTAKKMSGVCEDFANLFKELCDRSDIPCLVADGKAKKGMVAEVTETVTKFFRRQHNKIDHAWNVVKIGSAWKLMDPTWGSVLRTEKKLIYNAAQKRNVSVTIRIVNREYYDTDPAAMMKDHKPMHPAFFLTANVPTFKTGLKKEKRRKYYSQNYDYTAMLDSIYKQEYPMFSKAYQDELTRYSSLHDLYYLFKRQLILPAQKTATPVTIAEYETNLVEIRKLSTYIQQNFNRSMEAEVKKYEIEVNKKVVKLKQIQQQQKPKSKVAATK